MKIDNYSNWKEVLSEDEFRSILKELIKKKDDLSQVRLLEILSLLSEKYLLFYGATKLTDEEETFINTILIELTNFSIMEELIGILFNFRLDGYYSFLRDNLHLVRNDEVKNELLNSLKEYKNG